MKTQLSDLQMQREPLDIYALNKQSRAVSWAPRWQQGSRDTTRTGQSFYPSPASVAISDPGGSDHDPLIIATGGSQITWLLHNMGKRGVVPLMSLPALWKGQRGSGSIKRHLFLGKQNGERMGKKSGGPEQSLANPGSGSPSQGWP